MADPGSPEPSSLGGPSLWTAKTLAGYLARSERWVSRALSRAASDPGSIPHYRLPGGAARFDPQEIREWIQAGCPPATAFRSLRKGSS